MNNILQGDCQVQGHFCQPVSTSLLTQVQQYNKIAIDVFKYIDVIQVLCAEDAFVLSVIVTRQ